MSNLKPVIWVKPSEINYFQVPPHWWWYGRIQAYPAPSFIKSTSKYFYNKLTDNIWHSGSWDIEAKKFTETDWFIFISDLIDNRNNFKSSRWYIHAARLIGSNGVYIYKKKHIRTLPELDIFFYEYMDPLITSLSTYGWSSEISDEVPTGMIGRNGQIIKSGNGCHRLAILKAIDSKDKYPLRIVSIHPKIHTASNLPKYIRKIL